MTEGVTDRPKSADRRPLAERVRPDRLGQMAGNPEAVDELRQWAKGWQTPHGVPRLRAAILSGPPGVGKTTAAIALATELGWGLVEMNASDARNRRSIEQVAVRASLTHTFPVRSDLPASATRGRTLILLDEADCLFSRDTEAPAAEPAPVGTFRDFLRNRYGSVEALANAWGLGVGSSPPAFPEWSQVPASGGRSKAFRLAPAQRDLADWGETKSRVDLSDRGGLGAIAKLVRETKQPVILTVNDPTVLNRYSSAFRYSATRISFWPLRPDAVRSIVRQVAVREGLTVSAAAADAIVSRSRGDLRAALNDLDAVSALPPGKAQEALLGTRDVTSDFFDFTREFLETPRVYRSVEIRNRLDATPDDLLPWVEENLPRATRQPETRAGAFDELAVADLLLSRARRYRTYGLWSYASEIMTGGVGLVLARGDGHAPERIAFPQFLGAMGRSRATRAIRTAILSKSGRLLHMSKRKASESALDYLAVAFRKEPGRRGPGDATGLARYLVGALRLTAEEVAYLTGGAPDDPRVRDLAQPPEEPDRGPESDFGKGPPETETPTDGAAGAKGKGSKKAQKRLGDY